MTTVSCGEVEELLGAYALDALTAPETADVEQHLKGCAEHRRSADELRQTASLLALAVDEREPSGDLRRRVIASIHATAEPAIAPEPVPLVVPTRRAPRLPRWAPRPAFAALAAAALLALGVGSYAGYRLGLGSSQAVAYRFTGGSQAPKASASLVYLRDRHEAMLAVSGLPTLAPGLVYEMWLVDKSGLPVAEGVAVSQDGRITAQMSADLSRYKQFAITIEPGERQSPSSPAVLQGSLGDPSA